MLDVSNWKEFRLVDIVNIDYGNKFDLQDMTSDNPSVNFVSRTGNNNGVSSQVDLLPNKLPYPAGCLTVALGGSIGSTFYQARPFYTGQNIAVIQFPKEITVQAKLFLATIIMFEVKDRFIAFGRELNKHIKNDFIVRLPESDSKPDWQYMNDYIEEIQSRERESFGSLKDSVKTKNTNPEKISINGWKEFSIKDIFKCSTTKALDYNEIIEGDITYITRSALNNGCSGRVELIAEKLEKGNCITIGAEGKQAFYQFDDFLPGVKVYTLRHKNMNPFTGLFLCTILNSNMYKYSYGRARILSSIENENILLPSDSNGEPDWQYMENYIKSLPFADRL